MFLVSWERVELVKDFSIVLPALDGRFYHEDEAKQQRIAERLAKRKMYIELVGCAEVA